MNGPSVIPDTPEALTAEWLTEALETAFPGVEVAGVEVLASHSGTTGRVRLGIDYASGPSGPPSVFVKLPPFEDSQRQLVATTDMGRREARFYAGPAAEVSLRIPTPYFADHGDDPGEYVMVLEDLKAGGCRFSNRLEPLTAEESFDLIEGLAGLHAHFWEDSRFADELSFVGPAMRGEYGAKLVASAREQFADQFPPVFAELCRLYAENWEAIADLWDSGPKTMIHGDTHAGNQFVEGTRVGLYDWAVISRSPGVRDVAIYLGNSCPPELRSEGEEGWLRRYHEVLVEAGVDVGDFDGVWTRYRQTVLYAWVAATTTAAMGSRWQPIEVGMTGMTRATATCADLETVEAIRGAL